MQAVNLPLFKKNLLIHKRAFRLFLARLKKNPPRSLDDLAIRVDKEVWHEVDCLTCGNCCKTMSPTYTGKDIKRIAGHFEMTEGQFKKKWLYKDEEGDWLNQSVACQFLDHKTNMCGIYEIRPKDCAGFPHLPKKKMKDYLHIHKQNIEYCPATYKMVEKMKHLLEEVEGIAD